MSQRSSFNPTEQERKKAWGTLSLANKNTPDFFELKSSYRDEFLVFVTGHSRNLHYRQKEMKGCNFYGTATTYDERYIMKRSLLDMSEKQDDPFVFNFPSDKEFNQFSHAFEHDDLRGIEGEVYGVPLRRLTQIDKRQGNGEGCNRIERWVTLRSPIQDYKKVKAYMYVVDNDFFLDYYSYNNELSLCNIIEYNSPKKIEVYYTPRSNIY